MTLHHGFEHTALLRGAYVSIGNFDGVHRGHRAIIELLAERAKTAGAPAVVVTFNPHPIQLLRPEQAPPNLSTLEQKAALLTQCGADAVVVIATDRALLSLSPAEFFEQILVGKLAARGMVEGPNFYFGRNRAGDIDTLRALCADRGMTLDIAEPIEVNGDVVSSSRIRAAIVDGRMAEAIAMLGHPYQIAGIVARGAGRGRGLGFPTANLEGITTLLPPDGVYGGHVMIDENRIRTAVHIGPNPTFDDARRKFEVHLIDFDGDLYDRPLEVHLTQRIRGSRKFADVEELRNQLRTDIAAIRSH